MKKHLIAVLAAIVMCLAVLSGCSALKVFEKDVQVILEDRGAYVGTYTVNIFNNAVISAELEKPEDGYKLAGWSVKEDWTEGVDSVELLTENTNLIRYDDIKDHVADGSDSITLYAAYIEIPKHDIVIAWYDKESTSGLNQGHIDAFQTELYSFLSTEGYTPDSMDIVIRGYAGDVGTTCSEIKDDGDVDIMIGWSTTSNLTGTGGLVLGEDFIENNGGITIGAKERYAARLTDKELTNLVYDWIFETYGEPLPEEPEEPEEPSEEADLVIAWYSKEDTSGLNATYMDAFKAALETYLATQGYTTENTVIAIRAYDGKVGETCSAIKADGDVDIMVGWSTTDNLTGTGGMVEGTDFIENNGGVTIGAKERYAARLTDTELSKLVYRWIFSEYSDTPLEPEDPAEKTQVVIGWYAKEDTSGLNQTYMDAFKATLEEYLITLGYTSENTEIVLKSYDGTVGETCGQIKTDGDVDIMIGWSSTSNLTGTGGMVEGTDFIENNGGVTIGAKERYAARLTDTQLTNVVYDWIFVTYGQTEEPEPPAEEQTTLVIGWYSKSGTSGLDQTIIDAVTAGLNDYLASQGYTQEKLSVTFSAYDGTVAEVQTAVETDGNVDIMVGMKAFEVAGIVDVQENVAMGEKTDRRIHLLDDGTVSKLVFEWLKTAEARALFV